MLVIGTEPVDDMPILDLRIRKGVRRHGVKLAVATPRPSSLDPNAQLSIQPPEVIPNALHFANYSDAFSGITQVTL